MLNSPWVYHDRSAVSEVITLGEACHIFRKTRKTIFNQMMKGAIAFRKSLSGTDFLLSYADCKKLWKPSNPLEAVINE